MVLYCDYKTYNEDCTFTLVTHPRGATNIPVGQQVGFNLPSIPRALPWDGSVAAIL